MHTDKAIAEFEAWAIRDFGLTPAHLIKDAETGLYVNYPTQCYLDVWRASRAEMVIQMPPRMMRYEQPEYYLADQLHDAIEAAGAKWRE